MFATIRKALFAVLSAAVICVGVGAAAHAGDPPVQKYTLINAYYSPSLRAQFRVETFNLPAFGQFVGVRLVSQPDFGSPLNTLGLNAGDVITRLDGVRVDNLAELENHFSWTQIRYIPTGSQNVLIGNIFINNPGVPAGPGPFVPGGNAP